MPASDFQQELSNVRVERKKLNALFSGSLNQGKLTGTLRLFGASVPLTFERQPRANRSSTAKKEGRNVNLRRAFTMIELLGVLAVLGMLAALLLPALSRGQGGAERALCTSNRRQWGIALGAYAADCHNYFPDNRDGRGGPSWCGITVQNFWTGNAPLARLPFSSHVQASGEPTGGNFLFEDGHARWYGSRLVTLAATGGNWVFYYKISLE